MHTRKNTMNIIVMVSDSFLSLNVTCSVFKLNTILVMQIGTYIMVRYGSLYLSINYIAVCVIFRLNWHL